MSAPTLRIHFMFVALFLCSSAFLFLCSVAVSAGIKSSSWVFNPLSPSWLFLPALISKTVSLRRVFCYSRFLTPNLPSQRPHKTPPPISNLGHHSFPPAPLPAFNRHPLAAAAPLYQGFLPPLTFEVLTVFLLSSFALRGKPSANHRVTSRLPHTSKQEHFQYHPSYRALRSILTIKQYSVSFSSLGTVDQVHFSTGPPFSITTPDSLSTQSISNLPLPVPPLFQLHPAASATIPPG